MFNTGALTKMGKAVAGRNLDVKKVQAVMDEDTDEEGAAEELVVNEVLGKMFRGKKCTKDCSGHKAGYAWKQSGKGNKYVKSASFDEGYKS